MAHAKRAGAHQVWGHARHYAVDFYVKCGFAREGAPFDEIGMEHTKIVMPIVLRKSL